MRMDKPIPDWPTWRRAGSYSPPFVPAVMSEQERRAALSAELAIKYPPPERPAETITIYIDLPD